MATSTQTFNQAQSRLSAQDVIAVILAGGQGTRIRHLAPDLPKPMVPVMGRPFLEWLIRFLAQQGITRAVISSGYRADVIEAHFRNQPVKGINVSTVAESEPLGTAGGFLNAVRQTADARKAWLVLNGDSLTLAPLSELISAASDANIRGMLLGVSVPDAARFGTLNLGPDGTLLGFHEKRSGSGIINAGVYVFRNEVVNEFGYKIPLSFEYDVLPQLAARAALKVCVTKAPFLDIGTPETLPLAERFLQESNLPLTA